MSFSAHYIHSFSIIGSLARFSRLYAASADSSDVDKPTDSVHRVLSPERDTDEYVTVSSVIMFYITLVTMQSTYLLIVPFQNVSLKRLNKYRSTFFLILFLLGITFLLRSKVIITEH